MKLSEYDGKFFKVKRDGSFETLGFVQHQLSKPFLCFALSERLLKIACDNPDVSCVICSEALSENGELIDSGKGIAVSESARIAFIYLHNFMVENNTEYNIGNFDTQVGTDCNIHPMASIADRGVIIGNNVTIEEFVTVRQGCKIGDNVIIHAGAVIGAEGLNVYKDKNGHQIKFREVGQTYLAKDVEIGYHAIIAKGTLPNEATVIGENTYVDSLAVIGHADKIGNNCSIFANALICGNTVLEDGVRVNPMAILKDSITVGKNAIITLGAVVVSNVSEGARVTGNFAVEHSVFLAEYYQKLRNINMKKEDI